MAVLHLEGRPRLLIAHFPAGLGVFGDQLFAGFREFLAFVDHRFGLPSHVFVLFGLFVNGLLSKIGKPLVAHVRCVATADRGDYANSIELKQVKPVFKFPNLTSQYRYGGNWGYVQVAGILKSIKWKDLDSSAFDLSGSVVGWGFNLGTVLNAGEKVKFKLQGVAGKGIENYIADVTPDVGLQSQPGNESQPFQGVALPALGFFSFAEIKWHPKLESSVGYSMLTIQNSDLQAADAFRKGQYGLINFRYYAVPKIMIGAEYQFGRRDNFKDDFHSTGNKIQLLFEYNFQERFTGN